MAKSILSKTTENTSKKSILGNSEVSDTTTNKVAVNNAVEKITPTLTQKIGSFLKSAGTVATSAINPILPTIISKASSLVSKKKEEPVLQGEIITGPSIQDIESHKTSISTKENDLLNKKKNLNLSDPVAISNYNNEVKQYQKDIEDFNNKVGQYNMASKAKEVLDKEYIPTPYTSPIKMLSRDLSNLINNPIELAADVLSDTKPIQKFAQASDEGKFIESFTEELSKRLQTGTKAITGLTGGLYQPNTINEPNDIATKLFGSLSEGIGMATSIGGIEKTLFSGLKAPKVILDTFKNYPKVQQLFNSLATNIPAFATYGQLNPELQSVSDRVKQLGSDIALSIPFTALGLFNKESIKVPLSAALGYGMAKLQGASDEEAAISATSLGLLSLMGTPKGSKETKELITQKQAKQQIYDEAINTINKYSDIKLNQDSSVDEIKKAFKNAALKTHPDVGGNAKDFSSVAYARDILIGETKTTESKVKEQNKKETKEDISNIAKEMKYRQKPTGIKTEIEDISSKFTKKSPTIEGLDKERTIKLTPEETSKFVDEASKTYWDKVITPAKESGKAQIIGSDDMKDYFGKDYNPNNHPVYSQSAFKLYERAVKESKNPVVKLTIGGTGAGKSNFVVPRTARDFDGVIYDSTGWDYNGLKKQIDYAKSQGKEVELYGIVPDVAKSRVYTFLRELRGEHPVSEQSFIRTHSGAIDSMIKAIKDGVDVYIMDTRGKILESDINKGNFEFIHNPIGLLESLGYNEEYVRESIKGITKENAKEIIGGRQGESKELSKGDRSINRRREEINHGTKFTKNSRGEEITFRDSEGGRKDSIQRTLEKSSSSVYGRVSGGVDQYISRLRTIWETTREGGEGAYVKLEGEARRIWGRERIEFRGDTRIILKAAGFSDTFIFKTEEANRSGAFKNVEFLTSTNLGGKSFYGAYGKDTLYLNPDEVESDIVSSGEIINHELAGHSWYEKLDNENKEIFLNTIKQDVNTVKQAWERSDNNHLSYWSRSIKQIKNSITEVSNIGIAQKITSFLGLDFTYDIPLESFIDRSLNIDKSIEIINKELKDRGFEPISLKSYQLEANLEHVAMIAEGSGYILSDNEVIQNYLSDIHNGNLEYGPSSIGELRGKDMQFRELFENKEIVETSKVLRGTKGMTAEDIMKTYPNIQLKRDVVIKDIHGDRKVIPEGQKLTPYELKGNKILLQDGETYIVSKNQYENIKGQSTVAEAKPFAPELEETEETILSDKEFKKDADKSLTDIWKSKNKPTKYSQYTLPGGENYKEILIKAPTQEQVYSKNDIKEVVENQYGEWEVKLKDGTKFTYPDVATETEAKNQFQKDLDRGRISIRDKVVNKGVFKSSHWEEPNVIAHIRMNERTYNGKKVAFMEELQSDWARESRKQDTSKYIVEPETDGPLNNRWIVINTKNELEAGKFFDSVKEANNYAKEKNLENITHPLLKNWQELSIKRALQEAVNTNAKYFAWITGEQTSARYNLATYVQDVLWSKSNALNNEKVLTLTPKQGKKITMYLNEDGIIRSGGQSDWQGKKLDEVLGKGLADKIMADESGTLSGDGLSFGGEWAKNLYDKQVKAIVENLTGQKVEMLDMGLPVEKSDKTWSILDSKGIVGEGLTPKDLKVGISVTTHPFGIATPTDSYVITDVLNDGKFIVVEKGFYNSMKGRWFDMEKDPNWQSHIPESSKKTFSISDKKATQMAIEITPEVKNIIESKAPKIDVMGKLFREKSQELDNLRKQLERDETSLQIAIDNPENFARAYGPNKLQQLKDKVSDLKKRIYEVKFPVFETGNVLTDLKKSLDYAEKRVGLSKTLTPKEVADTITEEKVKAEKIRVTPANKIELSTDLKIKKDQIDGLSEMINFYKDRLMTHPGKKLQKFMSKKEGVFEDFRNPDLAKTPSEEKEIRERNAKIMKESESAFENSELAEYFDNPDIIREQIDEYKDTQEKVKDLEKERAELKKEFWRQKDIYIAEERDRLSINSLVAKEERRKVLEEVEKVLRKEGRERKDKVEAIQEYFVLTDKEMKDVLFGSPDIRLMTDTEFQSYLKGIEGKAYKLSILREAKMQIENTIHELELSKVENLREALKLPKFENMSLNQLYDFNALLETFNKGDQFLGKRQIETVRFTDMAGIKTRREALDFLAKESGIPIDTLNDVRVKEFDKFLYDTALARRNPLYKVMVDNVMEAEIQAGMRLHEIKLEANKLFKEARQSRKRTFLSKLSPTDKIIFDYLESPEDIKKEIAKRMTPAEYKAALYVREKYSEMRDYLSTQRVMDKFRNNYVTHIKRPFLESLLERGEGVSIWKGFKEAIIELFNQYNQDKTIFNILDGKTGEILPLEKFFKFSISRKGNLIPTKNVLKAFLTYTNTFEKKRQFDSFIPKIDIFAHALSSEKLTPRGLIYDDSLKRFVKMWLNSKKGRTMDLGFIKQGDNIDWFIRSGIAITRMLDLGASIPIGLASQVGEQSFNFIASGPKKYIIGKARYKTKQGKTIVKKYESFIGESFIEKMRDTSKDIGDKTGELFFGLFSAANRKAFAEFLLANMTKEEFRLGELSKERTTELVKEFSRYHVVPGQKSLVGKTAVGALGTQYKSWAVPPLHTTIDNISKIIEMAKAKEFKKTAKSKEFQELLRGTLLTALILLLGYRYYDKLSKKKDRNFLENLAYKAMNDGLSLLGAFSPMFWIATPRLIGFMENLTSSLQTIAVSLSTGDRTEEGKIPGMTKFSSTITPNLIKQFTNDDKDLIDKMLSDQSKTSKEVKEDKTSEYEKIKELMATDKQLAKEEMLKMAKSDPDTAKQILQMMEDDKLGLTDEEKKIKSLGVDNKFRAQYIYTKMISLKSNEEQKQYLLDLTKKKIINKEVLSQVLEMKKEGKPLFEEGTTYTTDTLIKIISAYAKAINKDPMTAFKAMFTREQLEYVKGNAVILKRIPYTGKWSSENIAQKRAKEMNVDRKVMNLDHIIPRELGGDNSEKNLRLVPEDVWVASTPVENYLGKLLRSSKITRKEAQKAIVDFKNGTMTFNEIKENYK